MLLRFKILIALTLPTIAIVFETLTDLLQMTFSINNFI